MVSYLNDNSSEKQDQVLHSTLHICEDPERFYTQEDV